MSLAEDAVLRWLLARKARSNLEQEHCAQAHIDTYPVLVRNSPDVQVTAAMQHKFAIVAASLTSPR